MDQFRYDPTPPEGSFNLPDATVVNEDNLITMFPQDQGNVLDPQVLESRAIKYHFAMDQDSTGLDNIRTALIQGSEPNLRLHAVANEKLKAEMMRRSIADDIVRGKGGEPLNPQETSFIKGLTDKEAFAARYNPDTIMEKLYANRVVNMANTLSPQSMYHQLIANGGQDEADKISSKGVSLIATQEIVKHKLEEVNKRWQEAGWASTISNYAEQIVPFFSWYNLRNAIPSDGPQRSFLPGNNLEEQITAFYSMPEEKAQEALRQTIDVMERANPLDAMMFLQALLQFTNTDRFLANSVGVVDIASVTPITTLARAARGTGMLMKDIVKLNSKGVLKAEEVASAAGEKQLATVGYFNRVSQGLQERLATENLQASWDDMYGKLTLHSNPKAFLEGSELAKDAMYLERVTQELTATSARMIDGIFLEPIQIQRLTPGTPAFEEAIKEAISRVSRSSPYAADNFMYALPVESPTLTGANYLDMHYGMRGGIPFETEAMAKGHRTAWYMPNSEIVPEGNGFVLKMRVGIHETDGKVRSVLTPTDAPTPRDRKNLFMSMLRSPNELLPKDLVTDRALATYGISKLTELGRNLLSDIKGSLSRKEWKTFDEFITRQRDYKDPTTGQRGKFNTTLAEFEQEWLARTGALPKEHEAFAYMRYVQLNDIEYAVLNTTNYKNKTAMGIQQIRLPLGRTADDFAASSPAIEGRIIREDPFKMGDDFSAFIWKANIDELAMPENYIANSSRVKGTVPKFKERIEREGLTFVQVTKSGWEKLKADPRYADILPAEKVDYFLIKNPKVEALPINQLPYRPGGHARLKDGFFVAQPDILKRTKAGGGEVHYYFGDRNLTHFVQESDAKDFYTRLDKARIMYNDVKGTKGADMAPLQAYLQTELGGAFSLQEFAALFKKGGPFKSDIPFSIRASGSSIGDTENLSLKYPNLRMGGDDVHSVELQRLDPQAFKERGDVLESFAWRGSPHAPVLERVAAELVDPIDTMEASFQSVMRSKYIDDLRVKTMERFINEFAHVLDAPIEQLRANPWSHLLDPVYKTGAAKEDIQAAKNLRRTFLEFMGIRTPLEKEIQYVKTKIHDSLYTVIGKDGVATLEKGKKLLDDVTLGATKDPVAFMRTLAFREKMGLFNVRQLFTQAQNITSVMAIEGPTRGIQSAYAYWLHRGMMINNTKEVREGLAAAGAKLGWKKEDLLESFEAGHRSGFFRVGDEVAYMDGGATPSINRSTLGVLIEKGDAPFKEGERFSRITAWNAAYLNWKQANPGKALNDLEIGKILARADDLNGNMSRASSAAWQQGIFSIPTQFWGYQARIAELMLGKRLTTDEKFRMVLGQSLMYGIPTGVAITGAGLVWPWHEATRKYMVENGWNYDQNILTRIGTEGFGGIANGLIFGEQTNFSESFSAQGLSVIRDLMDPKKGLFDMMIGVSGTTLRDNIKSMHPFAMALLKVAGVDNGYDLTPRDFVDATSSISSLSNASKAMHAYYTQEYWSKKEQKIAAKDVSAVQALLMATTGIIPKDVADGYAMISSLKDRKAMQDELRTEITKNLRLAYKAGTVQEADGYLRRAQIHFQAGKFTPQEYQQIINHASQGWESMIDSVTLKYAQTSKERMDAFLRKGQ